MTFSSRCGYAAADVSIDGYEETLDDLKPYFAEDHVKGEIIPVQGFRD